MQISIDFRAKFAPTFQPTDETRATTVAVVAPYVMPQPPAPVHPQTVAGNNILSTTASAGTSPSSLSEKVIGEEDSVERSTNGTSNGTITVPVADETNDFSGASTTTTPLPPPPEVAERIIANLLPRYVVNSRHLKEYAGWVHGEELFMGKGRAKCLSIYCRYPLICQFV